MNSHSIIRRAYRALLIFIILLSTCALALAQRHERVVDAWQPVHYDVSLTFNDQLSEIEHARTVVNILVLKDKTNTLDLDFGEMKIDSVMVNGAPTRYERRPGSLIISLAEPAQKDAKLSVEVNYHGQPKDGLILTADKDGRPSAIGDNWPNRVHHWIPCLDHPSAKATVNFNIKAPSRDLVVANGRLTGTNNTSKARAELNWSYKEDVPIPPYCMVIAVGEFALLNPAFPAITPLSYYVPKSDRVSAVQGFAPAAPSLQFFSETINPYPYEKLALIVGATRFGGMENSSAIVFTSTLFDQRNQSQPLSRRFNIRQGIEEVVAHEIAHQWFGDSVTERTWSDLWLSEGFATYFAGLFLEKYEGTNAFRDYMRRAADSYVRYEQTNRTPIFDPNTEDLFKLLNANNYQKGAWVLHMLRKQMGDAAFFRGLRDYDNLHHNQTATTEDLRTALEKSSGTNLKEFFKRWVYEAGHPRYELAWNWQQSGASGGTMTMTLRQLQVDAPFLNPLPVEVLMQNGSRRVIFHPTSKETTMRLRLSRRPTDVRVDPDETVLKEVRVKASS